MIARLGTALAAAKLVLVGTCFLVASVEAPAYAAFPGHNGRIVFVGVHADSESLELVNPDGSGRVILHELVRGCCHSEPAWSADGRRLAFVDRSAADSHEIFMIDASGGGLTQFTSGGQGDRRFNPAWSPDGARIANARVCVNVCVGQVDPVRGGIFVADGTAETLIVEHDQDPAWSPDGNKIAFDTFRHEPNPGFCFSCNTEIYLMNPDGTGQTRISNSPTTDALPNWSPDGTKIAFVSDRAGNSDIYTMNADGSGQMNVTNSPAFDSEPAWSPDGSKIAFMSRAPGGNSDIYTINPDGTGLANITNTSTAEISPDWQPISGPRPEDYGNPRKFCQAERAFLGEPAFRQKYGQKHAFRTCVKRSRDRVG